MGLDVYLYRYEDFVEARSIEDTHDAASTVIWEEECGEGTDATEEQRAEYRRRSNENAKGLGMVKHPEYGHYELPDEVKRKIELDSEQYPEHMFKVGYFRSSYNSSGIDSVLNDAIGMKLYDVFSHTDDEYAFQPDWERAREVAQQMIAMLQGWIAQYGSYRASSGIARYWLIGTEAEVVNNSEAALRVFLEEKTQHEKRKEDQNAGFASYSGAKGEFYLDEPLPVAGIIHGVDIMGQPCDYVVYKVSDDYYGWHIQALEIVIETCNWVLAQDDPEKYYLHWSS